MKCAGPRSIARALLRLPRERAAAEAQEAASCWGPATPEQRHREQLHAIVCLLEDGRADEALAVAGQGPWPPAGDGSGAPRRRDLPG